jgi:hypothetical protein
MIKDFLVSFKDNFKDKTRNPFLGTYLMVWIIRNWELLYTIFNFDKDIKLKKKIAFINHYYSENDFIGNLWTNLYWAFGLLILTYILLNLSRLIVNLSEKKITPWIYKITDGKSVVLKETYNKLKNEINLLESNLEKERQSKGRLQFEISKLDKKIEELNLNKIEDNEKLVSEYSEKNKADDEVDIMFKKLKEKKWLNEYLDSVNLVYRSEDGWVNHNEIGKAFEYFIKLGLFDISEDNVEFINLNISELGDKVLRKVRLGL